MTVWSLPESLSLQRRHAGGVRAVVPAARDVSGEPLFLGGTSILALVGATLIAYVSLTSFVLQDTYGLLGLVGTSCSALAWPRRGQPHVPSLAGVTSKSAGPGRPAGLSPGLDRTFMIGLLLKAADGVLEIVGGALLLIVSGSTIDQIARTLTAHELSEDPHDRIAQAILHTTAHLSSGATLFAAIYLLSHGVSKVVLVALVIRNKLWAYPWLIALLGVFIAYQLYVLILVKFSWGLAALTAFDVFLVWLTWREYQAKRAGRGLVVGTGSPPGAMA